MPCPDPSTLTKYKIGGQIDDLCADPVPLTVTVLMNSGGNTIVDPTNNAIISTQQWQFQFTDGCWCTCALAPNTATAVDGSLTPESSSYTIRVSSPTQTVYEGTLALDAETLAALTPFDLGGDCGEVILLTDLLPDAATVPPTATFCDAVTACPTVGLSTMTANADGSFTHDNGKGVTVTIPAPATTATSVLTANADGSFSHNNGLGTIVTIPAPAAGLTSVLTANPDGSFTHNDGAGTLVTIPAHVPSSMTANADGTFSHVDGAGNTVTIPAPATQVTSVLTANADGSFTHDNGTGTQVTIPAPAAGGNTSVLTANADGSFTHDNGTGTQVTIPAPTGPSVLTANVDGSFTHNDGTGTLVTIPAHSPSVMTVNADGSYTHNDGAGNLTQIAAPAAGGNTSVLTANADGSFTHNDGAGTLVVIPAPAAAVTSTLTANPDGTYTHTNGAGATTTITAEQGEAVVTDNLDNTTTITGTDVNGATTTDTVINQLNKCDGTAIVPGTDTISTICAAEARTEAGAAIEFDNATETAILRIDPTDDCAAGVNALEIGPNGGLHVEEHYWFSKSFRVAGAAVTGPLALGDTITPTGLVNMTNPTNRAMRVNVMYIIQHAEMQVWDDEVFAIRVERSIDGAAFQTRGHQAVADGRLPPGGDITQTLLVDQARIAIERLDIAACATLEIQARLAIDLNAMSANARVNTPTLDVFITGGTR